jgi:murein DD-endopeptidase MepM/ murein hydrolase activator NlpD
MEVDSAFHKFKVHNARRRRRGTWRRVLLIVGGLVALCVPVTILFGTGILHLKNTGPDAPETLGPGEPPADAATFVPAFVDLRGNALRISLSSSADAEDKKSVRQRPVGVPPERAPGNVVVLADTMVAASQRFMATLPSSPQDFAFYQTLKVSAPVHASAAETPAVAVAPGADEGTTPAAGDVTNAPAPPDTTSVAVVMKREQRALHDRDFFSKVLVPRSLASLIVEEGLSAGDGNAFDAAMQDMLGKLQLDGGDVVAIRAARNGGASAPLNVVQVSLYSSSKYLGTLARGDDNSISTGGPDPWVPEDLFKFSGEENVSKEGQQYRLLDAVYSTALRNDVPSEVLNQAIALLSRSFDLSAFASPDDKLLLAFSPEAAQTASGGVLFVGVQGTGRDIQCFAYQASANEDFSCSNGTTAVDSGPRSGPFVVPVNGTLIHTFGTQLDAATGKAVPQTGMEWAARPGSPVVAAFAGTVSYVGPGDEGNMIKIVQVDGRESRFYPLEGFARGLAKGTQVKAGDLIGYVGTDPSAPIPYLHFELRADDKPIDPMNAVEATGSDAAVVEEMTNKIIRIESAGSATAKNPNSTASGLGQFTEGTWIRMMQTYRRDLYSSMSTADLLNLRFNPDLSREMVKNLAREGDYYLKGKGITVTPGRLYLCHFLGAGSAAIVLAAGRSTPLSSLLSDGVFNANKFLIGMTSGDVEDWADRLMNRGGKGSSAPPQAVVSPEFQLYRMAILELMAEQPAAPAATPAPDAASSGSA